MGGGGPTWLGKGTTSHSKTTTTTCVRDRAGSGTQPLITATGRRQSGSPRRPLLPCACQTTAPGMRQITPRSKPTSNLMKWTEQQATRTLLCQRRRREPRCRAPTCGGCSAGGPSVTPPPAATTTLTNHLAASLSASSPGCQRDAVPPDLGFRPKTDLRTSRCDLRSWIMHRGEFKVEFHLRSAVHAA